MTTRRCRARAARAGSPAHCAACRQRSPAPPRGSPPSGSRCMRASALSTAFVGGNVVDQTGLAPSLICDRGSSPKHNRGGRFTCASRSTPTVTRPLMNTHGNKSQSRPLQSCKSVPLRLRVAHRRSYASNSVSKSSFVNTLPAATAFINSCARRILTSTTCSISASVETSAP